MKLILNMEGEENRILDFLRNLTNWMYESNKHITYLKNSNELRIDIANQNVLEGVMSIIREHSLFVKFN